MQDEAKNQTIMYIDDYQSYLDLVTLDLRASGYKVLGIKLDHDSGNIVKQLQDKVRGIDPKTVDLVLMDDLLDARYFHEEMRKGRRAEEGTPESLKANLEGKIAQSYVPGLAVLRFLKTAGYEHVNVLMLAKDETPSQLLLLYRCLGAEQILDKQNPELLVDKIVPALLLGEKDFIYES